jgi:hypothetical protein
VYDTIPDLDPFSIAYINPISKKKEGGKIQESINIPFLKSIVRNREKESRNRKKKW